MYGQSGVPEVLHTLRVWIVSGPLSTSRFIKIILKYSARTENINKHKIHTQSWCPVQLGEGAHEKR